jgi:glycerol-3-phosphate dehydrogenase
MTYDLFIIGGGVNGCGIARDASGRGLKVFLAEQGDLASGTSSGSTKLIHGGLRYLEHYEFRLVREALIEREVLLRLRRTSSGRCASCCRTIRACAPGR